VCGIRVLEYVFMEHFFLAVCMRVSVYLTLFFLVSFHDIQYMENGLISKNQLLSII
jgi:hypothetical protein